MTDQKQFDVSLSEKGIVADSVNKVGSLSFDTINTVKAYLAGQISYDEASKGHLFDTGYTDVRVNAGQELHSQVFNDTGFDINNGDPVSFTLAVDVTTGLPKVAPTTSDTAVSVLAFAGVATMDIPDGQSGLVTPFGLVRDFDTSLFSEGFVYADSSGGYTQTRPVFPAERLLIGGITKVGELDGIISVKPQVIRRRSASRAYSFTSADAAAGTHYRAGFYGWATTSVALNQGSLSVVHGAADLTKAAHVGIVAAAAGIVDTGQVGIQVTGTLDDETGPQTASQTAVITDDITTLTTNMMMECIEKFSGAVTLSLYTVSGSPAAYSVTINYGFSKYEDILNIDGTVVGFSAVWEAGANDTVFNIKLKHHKAAGWTYAASGFEAGNGSICERLVDQAIASDLSSGEDGAYKRIGLNQFIKGSEKEGIIIEIETGSTQSIRSMDIHVSAFSEELG